MDFNDLVEERCEKIKETLVRKGKEYGIGGNRFHNFDRAAEKRNTYPEDALMAHKSKHDVSVDDLCETAENNPEKLSQRLIDAKIGDSINYLILLEGLLLRRIDDCKKRWNIVHGGIDNGIIASD